MWWVAWWTVVVIVGACGRVASTNSVRFERRIAREVREMAPSSGTLLLNRNGLAELPDPVRRYLSKAVGARQVRESEPFYRRSSPVNPSSAARRSAPGCRVASSLRRSRLCRRSPQQK
jgi:hypothetical protein